MLLILPWKIWSGIGVQADFGGVTQAHVGQIVFVHVADDPDLGQVRNRERVRAQRLHARGIRDLLVGDHSRDRRVDVHDAVWLIGVVAEQPEMLCRSFNIDFGLVFGVLGDLKIVHRDGAVGVEILRPVELRACQRLVGNCLPVVGIAPKRHRRFEPSATTGPSAPCRPDAREYPRPARRPAK